MFSQFQARYPMGSLVSELLQIYDGNYVVRAIVQVGGITLATGMAAAPEISQAENQARVRALAVLGIQPPIEGTQAHQLVDSEEEARSTPATSSPKISDSIPSHPQVERLADQTFSADHPGDWSMEEEAQLSGFSSTPQSLNPSTNTLLDIPNQGSQNGKVVTQPSRATPKNGTPPGPIDLSDAIAQTSVELKRLNWSDTQGRSYLKRTYGKRSRQQLTDEELLEFLYYLQSQPSPNEPSF